MSVMDRLKAVQIKANLIADDDVGLMEINAKVIDDVAFLTGEVENEEQKRIAKEIASNVEGIKAVRNELQVVPMTHNWLLAGQPEVSHLGYGLAEGNFGDTAFSISGAEEEPPGPGMATTEQFPDQFTDEEIEREVHHKLDTETDVDVSRIEISSSNQIVCIKGCVKTQEELDHLLDTVLNVRGAMGVDSEVRVEQGEIGTPLV